ncbi:hypothetical protein J3F84DRAFT_19952 [Trichoderma pleuroticola]
MQPPSSQSRAASPGIPWPGSASQACLLKAAAEAAVVPCLSASLVSSIRISQDQSWPAVRGRGPGRLYRRRKASCSRPLPQALLIAVGSHRACLVCNKEHHQNYGGIIIARDFQKELLDLLALALGCLRLPLAYVFPVFSIFFSVDPQGSNYTRAIAAILWRCLRRHQHFHYQHRILGEKAETCPSPYLGPIVSGFSFSSSFLSLLYLFSLRLHLS